MGIGLILLLLAISCFARMGKGTPEEKGAIDPRYVEDQAQYDTWVQSHPLVRGEHVPYTVVVTQGEGDER